MEDEAETYSVTLCEKPSGKRKGKGKGKWQGKGQLNGKKSQINNEPVIGVDVVK